MIAKPLKFSILILLLTGLGMVASAALAAEPGQSQDLSGADSIAGQVVMRFEPGTPAKKVKQVAEQTGYTVVKYEREFGLALFEAVEGAAGAPASVSDLAAIEGVQGAGPNYVYQAVPVAITPVDQLNTPAEHTEYARNRATGEMEAISLPIDPDTGQIQGTATYPVESEYQWGWFRVRADIIWPNITKAVGVAVLDTGVDKTHPDLVGRVMAGYDYVNADLDPSDDNGHGTHVAGVIGALASNKSSTTFAGGVSGVSNANIYPYKVLGAQGSGTSYEIYLGLMAAANNTYVKVINMSLGGGYDYNVEYAVEYATTPTNQLTSSGKFGKGKLLVVAAGNSDQYLDCATYETYPACYAQWYSNIIVVGATGRDTDQDGWPANWDEVNGFDQSYCQGAATVEGGTPITYTNYGGYVDIVAPGTDIVSTVPMGSHHNDIYTNPSKYWGNYAAYTGTSMATPHVAGAAARVWGQFPTETAGSIKDRLLTKYTIWPSDNPACWGDPSWVRPFLNVAAAMDRTAIVGTQFASISGTQVPDGTVELKRTVGTALVAQGKDTLAALNGPSGYFRILNIPVPTAGTWDRLYVNSAKYTSLSQFYDWWWSDPSDRGLMWYYGDIYLPEKLRHTFVTNWWPQNWTWPYDHWVGSYVFVPYTASDYDWVGTLYPWHTTVDNDYWYLTGALTTYPYSRVMYRKDGEHPLNTMEIATTPIAPYDYYLVVTNTDTYDNDLAAWEPWPHPVGSIDGLCARFWSLGVLKGYACLDTLSTDEFWVFGKFNGSTKVVTVYDNLVFDEAALNALLPSPMGSGFGVGPMPGEGSGPIPPTD